MTRQEFIERIRTNISPHDYLIVECVYTWHPSVPNVGGKEKIAALYMLGGMDLMMDMYARAKAIRDDYENTREKLKQNAGRMAIIGITIQDLQRQILELNCEHGQLAQEQEQLKRRLDEIEGR